MNLQCLCLTVCWRSTQTGLKSLNGRGSKILRQLKSTRENWKNSIFLHLSVSAAIFKLSQHFIFSPRFIPSPCFTPSPVRSPQSAVRSPDFILTGFWHVSVTLLIHVLTFGIVLSSCLLVLFKNWSWSLILTASNKMTACLTPGRKETGAEVASFPPFSPLAGDASLWPITTKIELTRTKWVGREKIEDLSENNFSTFWLN